MARALVYGASTFLGAHLCARLLLDGHDVTGVDRVPRSRAVRLVGLPELFYVQRPPTQPVPVPGNVDPRALERHELPDWDFVFQIAAPSGPHDLRKDPYGGLYAGSEATVRLAEHASRTRATFVLVSAAILLPRIALPNRAPFAEEDSGPTRYAEQAALGWGRYGDAEVRLARVHGTYGPGMPRRGNVLGHVLTDVVRAAEVSAWAPGPLDLCHVTDVTDGLLRLAMSEVSEPVAFGSDRPISLNQLVDTLDEVVGRPIPRGVVQTGNEVGELDLGPARDALGWRPKTALSRGLQDTLTWFGDPNMPPATVAGTRAALEGGPLETPPVRSQSWARGIDAVHSGADTSVPATSVPGPSEALLTEVLGLFGDLDH